MSKRLLLIRDLTLRDGQQSQFATRMNQAQVDRLLPAYKKAHFYAMEVWGGAVPDSVMRYLDEDPWKRLESIKAGIGGASKLTALSRGRNLFGYAPYPDSVIAGFCKNAVESGVDIMRIFDALNDIDNMKSSIRFVQEAGGWADCAVCYTVDPKFSRRERLSARLHGKKLPGEIFGVPYFVEKAKELVELGADMISIKDMAGLIDPFTANALVRALKSEVEVPIDLHTHCTPGYGVASVLAAMVAGVDLVDTVLLSWSGGPAAPAYEIVQLFADRLGLETGVDRGAAAQIDRELRAIRVELSAFDQYKVLPPELDLGADKNGELPPEVIALFDGAIDATVARKFDASLELCQRIEAYFNYPKPNEIVKRAQIPGGMYTNMLAQLKEAKLEGLVDEVLAVVPEVRLAAGVPPLVTPTSQIVGAQAVNCVIDRHEGKPPYTNVSRNFAELVKGSYGKTPWPVDPAFREKITGSSAEAPYDTSSYRKPDNPALPEAGGAMLAQDEKELLLLDLFPSVAAKFLRGKRAREWEAANPPPPPVPPKPERYPAAFWESELTQGMRA
jgi:pyruvate/oxaloacetate carboxyltransferase